MIEEKFVDLYARNSGLRDKLVAERDIVLTYVRLSHTDHPKRGIKTRTKTTWL